MNGFDGAGFTFRRLQHGRITQPRIERFQIRRKVLGIFLARRGEVSAKLVEARVMIMLFGSFGRCDEAAGPGKRIEMLRDLFQVPTGFTLATHQPNHQEGDEAEQSGQAHGPLFCAPAQFR